MGSGAWGKRIALGAALLSCALAPASASADPRAGIFNEARQCIVTTGPSRAIPPPTGGDFEIRILGGDIPDAVGENLQIDLVQHRVQSILAGGLGAGPPGFPPRVVPLYLTDGRVESGSNAVAGVTAQTCENSAVEAILMRVNMTRRERAAVGAHELFHAHSSGVTPLDRPTETWWEEAAASWSEAKTGFGEASDHDDWLQRPQVPLDSIQGDHEYAMGRFVHFLEDRGHVGGPSGDWPLHKTVIAQYGSPGPTQALADALGARGTSLADELAAFWGDRLKRRAAHGPPLRLSQGRRIRVRPGNATVKPSAESLGTWFRHFQIAESVKRVEFEFEPQEPTPGQFWAALTPETSQRIRSGDSVAFCVGGPGAGALEWPRRGFPVTFTNGARDVATLASEIHVFAQRDAEQCGTVPGNRACKLLARAGVSGLFGGGQYPFHSTGERMWRCVFVNSAETKEVDLIVNQSPPGADLRDLRRRVRRALAEGGYAAIPEGDVAGIQQIDAEGTVVQSILMLVGREFSAINVYNAGAGEARAVARGVAGALD